MRVHVIEHPNQDGRYLIHYERPCLKPTKHCGLKHLHVFTDEELSYHDLNVARKQFEDAND